MAMQKVVVHWVRKYYLSVFLEIKVLPSLLVLSQRFFFPVCNQIFTFVTNNTLINEFNAIWPMDENQA